MNRQYYQMEQTGNEANITIYGDISSYGYDGAAMNVSTLSRALDALTGVSNINVYINSYGGEVAEGLAIYNALKRHKAKVTTYCDGFAASIASVIFMAGDERVMNESSLLMIHNAWTWASGNAEELRKQADDLEKITQASVAAYKSHSVLEESEIKALMDAETWILPEEAMEYGFATKIDTDNVSTASQRARMSLCKFVKERTKPEIVVNLATVEQPQTNDEPTVEQPNDEPTTAEPVEETNENKPAEMFSGLFNAILKM